MQTTFDGPFGTGTGRMEEARDCVTLVAMRSDDGGLELLGEDMTVRLSPDDVRTLLFYGSSVELEGPGEVTATVSIDHRRYAVVLVLDGCSFRAPRWAVTAVARGRLPAAYLQAGRPGRSAVRSIPHVEGIAQRMAEARS